MSLANKIDISIKKSREYTDTVTNVTVPWSQLQLEWLTDKGVNPPVTIRI